MESHKLTKKVLGLMKDENNGQIMSEFVGLRAKMYSYLVHESKHENLKGKGIKKSTLKTITFNDYLECLFKHKTLIKTQNIIQSKKHQVFTVENQKLALSWSDDKRQLLNNSTDTLPWGYKE
jgi:hypothetical protein